MISDSLYRTNKRNRLLYTVFILFVFKLLCYIPVPLLNKEMFDGSFMHKGIMASLNIMAGGSTQKLSIMCLGLTPSVMVQIFMKLIKNWDPSFKSYDKNPLKRRQLSKIARWCTIISAAVFGSQLVFGSWPRHPNLFLQCSIFAKILMVFYLIFGALVSMWLTERINNTGIGNGFGAILLTSIVSSNASSLYYYIKSINAVEGYFNVLQALLVILLFNIFLLLNVYLLIFNRKRSSYLLALSGIVPTILLYAKVRSEVLLHLKQSMLMFSLIGCIFSFFGFIILYFEDIVCRYKVCLIKQTYTDDSRPDIFPLKGNPGGVTPVIVAENSMVIMDMGIEMLRYAGLFTFFNVKLNYDYITILKFLWKSVIIFLSSVLWTEVEFDPCETADRMRGRAFFSGVAEGIYTQRFIERFIWLLSMIGGAYLLLVVIAPDVINEIAAREKIFTGAMFNGPSIILIVSSADELCRRVFQSPNMTAIF